MHCRMISCEDEILNVNCNWFYSLFGNEKVLARDQYPDAWRGPKNPCSHNFHVYLFLSKIVQNFSAVVRQTTDISIHTQFPKIQNINHHFIREFTCWTILIVRNMPLPLISNVPSWLGKSSHLTTLQIQSCMKFHRKSKREVLLASETFQNLTFAWYVRTEIKWTVVSLRATIQTRLNGNYTVHAYLLSRIKLIQTPLAAG